MEYILVLALKRFDTPKEDRTMTHVIIDEFDNFITAGDNIKTILKEAGKYNLFLTLAHQIISDIKDTSLRDTILSMTEMKIVCRNSNKTLDAINKTHNINLEAENLNKGEQYIVNGNNIVTKSKNSTRFLDATEEISDEQWEEIIQHQFKTYYRPINQNTSSQQPTDDELKQMIQKFKDDFKAKNLDESSCLRKLRRLARDKFKEIISDWKNTNEKTPKGRIRQQEISTIFQLAFGLTEQIPNEKFIDALKNKSANDMFNQTKSGSRLKIFTDNGKTKTELYYYFE
jgi:arsenate reductase-like glutaredoxin family protein